MLDDVRELALAREERRRRNGQVRAVDGLEWRELAVAKLKHALRRA
ncbi:MAG TPA: hypothetical protein VFR38_17815 [Gaiellaceae bacterium]|nr:hypothetical protein [Gaiellaceae bacterium]